MHWYFDVLKKYATFSGRARRQEFWMFTLFHILIGVLLLIVAVTSTPVPFVLYILAVYIPSWAVSVRRLHDTGTSGWWMLVSFIPVVGIVILVFYVRNSDPGPNRYGPNPKMVPVPA